MISSAPSVQIVKVGKFKYTYKEGLKLAEALKSLSNLIELEIAMIPMVSIGELVANSKVLSRLTLTDLKANQLESFIDLTPLVAGAKKCPSLISVQLSGSSTDLEKFYLRALLQILSGATPETRTLIRESRFPSTSFYADDPEKGMLCNLLAQNPQRKEGSDNGNQEEPLPAKLAVRGNYRQWHKNPFKVKEASQDFEYRGSRDDDEEDARSNGEEGGKESKEAIKSQKSSKGKTTTKQITAKKSTEPPLLATGFKRALFDFVYVTDENYPMVLAQIREEASLWKTGAIQRGLGSICVDPAEMSEDDQIDLALVIWENPAIYEV